MSRPIKRIYDCATGETIDREMNDDEFAQYESDQAVEIVRKTEVEAKATAKAALLDRLGITADEAKLLLSQHNLREVCILKPWLSKAAVQLREQIDDSFPERIRKSDGWIGDARHSTRKSDHNPDTNGCVRAIDIDARLSDDKGLSAYLADQIRSYGKTNGRISYVIHQSKIASPILGWRWRKYKGNPHNHHVHVSFKKNQDNNSDFFHIPLLGGNA